MVLFAPRYVCDWSGASAAAFCAVPPEEAAPGAAAARTAVAAEEEALRLFAQQRAAMEESATPALPQAALLRVPQAAHEPYDLVGGHVRMRIHHHQR